MKALKAISLIALVGALTAGATACGNSSTSPTGPSPSPSPAPAPAPSPSPSPSPTPASDPYATTYEGTVGADVEAFHRLVVPRDGAATFTLRWGNGGVDLDLGLTPDSCTDFWADACVHLADTNAASGTTESLARAVKAGETYRVWVVNYAHVAQAYTLDVNIP
jgi:hypothetical protein